MPTSAFTLAVAIAISGLSEAIVQKEIDYQSENFQTWWGTELVWRLDDLPAKGGVPYFRVPYSGYIYPDSAGGTMHVLQKYDLAFHDGRSLAASHEYQDVTAQQELTHERRGLFGLRRVGVYRTPTWHGHCNGWTAAAIRHAEPQRSVTRNNVVFSPADIKALLADIYMYSEHEFLGGIDEAINPGTLHVVLANWVGRGDHPVGMESTVGPEKWNYPVFAYSTSSARRSEREVEVKMNIAYSDSTQAEFQQSPRLKRVKYFHYMLELNEDGEIVGGRYFSDSSQIDMLWTPQNPTQGGEEGNERGNPHLDVKEILAMWRESVPLELRNKWYNIDPSDEDRILDASEEDNSDVLDDDTDVSETEAGETEASAPDEAVAPAFVPDPRPVQPVFRRWFRHRDRQ